MKPVDVVAVVGSCVPERHQFAEELARSREAMFVSAARLAWSGDPIFEAMSLVPWASTPAGAVVECPSEVLMTELVGEMAAEPDRSRLVAVVCVVDAAHILDDLRGDDYVVERRDDDAGYDYRARALLTVMQIEYASTIVLVNWSALSRNEISTVMALLNHLSPAARLRLQREKTDPIATREGYGAEQSAPGWVAILSDEFEPHMSDSRVTAFRYQQVRPLHPGRLSTLLDDKIEAGAFGTVVRSVGFCRFATRPETPVQWDHVGQMVSFEPLGRTNPLDEDEDLLAIGQDLAFIGLDIDKHGLIDALDETALTDSEFTAGPMAWRRFADPFPAWHTQRAD